MITNPKKVETGLDLIQFCTCIFYELDDGITRLLKYTIVEDEEPLWNSPDDDQNAVVIGGELNPNRDLVAPVAEVLQAPELQTYEQFVRSWESWVGNQADYITRSLERAAKKRSRKKVSEHQLALFSFETQAEESVPQTGEAVLQMALF